MVALNRFADTLKLANGAAPDLVLFAVTRSAALALALRKENGLSLLRVVCEHFLKCTATDGAPFGGLRVFDGLIVLLVDAPAPTALPHRSFTRRAESYSFA